MTKPPDQQVLLAVRRLCGPAGHSVRVRDINFSLGTGAALTIMGPSGAGKSTLLEMMACFRPSASGRVIFRGRNILGLAAFRLARLGLAMVAERPCLLGRATVLENLLLGRHAERRTGLLQHMVFPPWVTGEEVNHRRRVEEMIDLLDLHEVRYEIVGDLPADVQRTVDLGRALVMRPRLLLCDEVFRGLSPAQSGTLSHALTLARRRGVALVMTQEEGRGEADLDSQVVRMEAGSLPSMSEHERAVS